MLRVRTLLLPTAPDAWAGGTPDQQPAFERAASLARLHDATLHVFAVSADVGRAPGDVLLGEALPERPFRALIARAAAAHPGLRVVQADINAASVTDGILGYAAAVEPDLIVMATHGRQGIGHLVLGSETEAVVRGAVSPVMTVGPALHPDGGVPRHILAPVDFSDPARRALATARALAGLYGAEVHVLHAVSSDRLYGWLDVPTLTAPMAAELDRALRAFAAEAGGPDVPMSFHVVEGLPSGAILDTAAQLDAGLIVIATHGRRGLERAVMGSVAERVVQMAPCPVLVAKAFGAPLAEEPARGQAAARTGTPGDRAPSPRTPGAGGPGTAAPPVS